MKQWIKDFCWFTIESYKFMQGLRNFKFYLKVIPNSINHANNMKRWYNLTPQQRESWYLNGEGRTLQY